MFVIFEENLNFDATKNYLLSFYEKNVEMPAYKVVEVDSFDEAKELTKNLNITWKQAETSDDEEDGKFPFNVLYTGE